MDHLWTGLAKLSYLETDRLQLRPFRYDDWEVFYTIVGGHPPLPFIFPGPTSSQAAKELLVESFLKAPLGKWALIDKERNQLIGGLAMEQLGEMTRQAELSYFLHPSCWGRGWMTEAVTEISDRILVDLGFQNLDIVTHLENVASQRVAEKAGFTLCKQYKGSDRYTHQMRTYLRFRRQ